MRESQTTWEPDVDSGRPGCSLDQRWQIPHSLHILKIGLSEVCGGDRENPKTGEAVRERSEWLMQVRGTYRIENGMVR